MNSMRLWRILPFFFFFFLFFNTEVHAHVVDLTNKAQAQAYEDYYPLIARYKGTSGVTFESYSTYWNETKLKALEQELLKNKHGEELALLGSIKVFPDYPAGDNILGQYFALYQYAYQGNLSLVPNRYIYLYGGNEYTTVEAMAQTLAHEYGHHFTFYYLIEKEQLRPSQWLQSQYAASRQLFRYPDAHVDGSGQYEWDVAEILAEDYVQLFGSSNALKGHMQMNAFLPSPFEQVETQTYWSQMVGGTYRASEPFPLLLTNYRVSNHVWYTLHLYTYTEAPAYINAQDGDGAYAPVHVGLVPKGVSETTYEGKKMESSVAWLFHRDYASTVQFRVVQPTSSGFNRGSTTLRINYDTIDELVQPRPLFPDITDQEMKQAAELLYERGVITGYTDGTFRPNEKILRRHAALMLIRELGLTLPEGYVLQATDVKPTDLWYETMATVEAYGLFIGSNGNIRPNEYVTRAQMATILARAYASLYEVPTSNYTFIDVPFSFWAYDSINTLAYNGITIANPYRPNEHVTRGQFALFLNRTLNKK